MQRGRIRASSLPGTDRVRGALRLVSEAASYDGGRSWHAERPAAARRCAHRQCRMTLPDWPERMTSKASRNSV